MGAIPVTHFRSVLARVLDAAIREGMTLNEEGVRREGGYLHLYSEGGEGMSPVRLRFEFGNIPQGSRSGEFCREKVDRMVALGHISSWMSRDPDADCYGGGVHLDLGDFYASFSGLPEDADEAVILTTALMCGRLYATPLVSDERVKEILSVSDNQKFIALLTVCERELAA